jgi:hypothetical protein
MIKVHTPMDSESITVLQFFRRSMFNIQSYYSLNDTSQDYYSILLRNGALTLDLHALLINECRTYQGIHLLANVVQSVES